MLLNVLQCIGQPHSRGCDSWDAQAVCGPLSRMHMSLLQVVSLHRASRFPGLVFSRGHLEWGRQGRGHLSRIRFGEAKSRH